MVLSFEIWLDLGQHVFSAIVLVLTAGISSHLCFGYSSKKSRETFIGLILMIMMAFQAYHLILAALYVPATRFFVLNPQLLRSDCLESVKGTTVHCAVLCYTILYCTGLYSTLQYSTLFAFLRLEFMFLFSTSEGGKRPLNSMKNVDRNPCFCQKPSVCVIVATGKEIKFLTERPASTEISALYWFKRDKTLWTKKKRSMTLEEKETGKR